MNSFVQAYGHYWRTERNTSYLTSWGTYRPSLSRALVCPLCGDLWAIFRIEDDPLWAASAHCGFCPRTFIPPSAPVPGSVLIDEAVDCIDPALLESLPDELLRREYQLHLDDYINKELP